MKYTLFLLTLLFSPFSMWGQYDFQVDSTFNGGANLNLPFSIVADEGIFLQTDGKILVTARRIINADSSIFLVLRLNTDGSLDSTYNHDGINDTTTIFDTYNFATEAVMLSDDNLVVLGNRGIGYTSELYLHKYKADGSLDNQFGLGGVLKISEDSLWLSCRKLRSFNDTSMLVLYEAAYEGPGTFVRKTILCKINGNGQLDSSFAVNGKLVFPQALSYPNFDVALGPQGNIYILRNSYSQANGFNTSKVMQINPDWTISELFGIPDSTGSFLIKQFSVDEDGKIVLWGTNFISQAWVWRYLPSGIPDVSFAKDGLLETKLNYGYANVNQLILQPDGKLLFSIAGSAVAMRVNENGTMDYSFDLDGYAEFSLVSNPFYDSWPSSLVLQPDGKIIYLTADESYKIRLMRVKTRP